MDSPTWNIDDSRTYRELAPVIVPRRREQIATLLTLAPFATDEAFLVVDIGCGDGRLGRAFLELYPSSRVIGLDGAAEMRAAADDLCSPSGARFETRAFTLGEDRWSDLDLVPDLVVSSLALHHLPDPGKRTIFADIRRSIPGRGALLVADLVAPSRPESTALSGARWDDIVREQSIERTGSDRLFRRFQETHWNHFRHPDPEDRPSTLIDQLDWLRAAGFGSVDCFWLDAGHAIFGGYTGTEGPSRDVSYLDPARAAADRALET